MPAKKGCFYPRCPEIITEGSYCDKHKKKQQKAGATRAREVNEREQKFYNSTLWFNTSRGFRARHPNCRECAKKGLDVFAEEVDHIIPLKVAWHLRLTPSNLQSLCRSCHARKRAEEAKMYEAGTPGKTVIVCGPPGSGKTTFVEQRFRAGDLILDLDRLYSAISFQPLHKRPNEQVLLGYALAARDSIIEKAVLAGSRRPNFWFIVGAPDPIERKRFQEIFKAEVVVLAVSKEECLRRIEKANRGNIDKMREVIAEWWYNYEPRHEFETVYSE